MNSTKKKKIEIIAKFSVIYFVPSSTSSPPLNHFSVDYVDFVLCVWRRNKRSLLHPAAEVLVHTGSVHTRYIANKMNEVFIQLCEPCDSLSFALCVSLRHRRKPKILILWNKYPAIFAAINAPTAIARAVNMWWNLFLIIVCCVVDRPGQTKSVTVHSALVYLFTVKWWHFLCLVRDWCWVREKYFVNKTSADNTNTM